MLAEDNAISLIGKRYELQDKLGAGGMGTVYRALDRLTGQRVALKQVRPPEDGDGSTSRTKNMDRHLALVHEFQTLASLRHPHIISVLDYGFVQHYPDPDDEDQTPFDLPFFTLDLLENAPTIIDAAARLDVRGRLRLLVQMLQALAYLHRRGVLHRDLKPANVLVTRGEGGAPQVKLLDFGLAVLKKTPDAGASTSSSGAAGTFAYMSPEVLTGEGAVEASDLYSVGVIAYEMFAGRHPFSGANVAETIQNVLHSTVDTSKLNVPAEVQWVILRLMAKLPAQRYASASDAIAALVSAANLGEVAENPAIRESYLQAAEFVGRDAEIGQLTEALIEATEGRGSAWLIGGESGVGKSRLLTELRILALVRGALVLRGQVMREAAAPYGTWSEVLRWLGLMANPDDLEAGILKLVVPDIADLLGRPIPDAPDLAPEAAHTRLLDVVGALFRRVNAPVVLILEDLQWSRRRSLALLAHLNAIILELPLLILGSYRDDETPDLPVTLPHMRVMKLGRLDAEGIAKLSESMLGPAGRRQEVIELISKETEGNAFFVVEVVRALAEEAGKLENIGMMSLPERVAALGVDKLIKRRLDRVPAESRPLLETAAVAGRFLDLDLLDRMLLGENPQPSDEAWMALQLVDCADAAVLEVQNGRWCFAHDKLRESVLATLPTERAEELHRKVAEALESVSPDPTAQAGILAYHWRMAGDTVNEAHYSTIAGTQLVDTSAFSEALPLLERALELVRSQGMSTELQFQQTAIRNQMARAYWSSGDYERAQQHHEENLAISAQLGDWRGRALAHRGIGQVAESRGDYFTAREEYEASLKLTRKHHDHKGEAQALHALGNIANKTSEFATAEEYQQQAITLFRAIGDQRGEADVLRVLGVLASKQGKYAEAERYFSDSLSVARLLGNRRGMAGALNNLGVNAESTGRYSDAVRFYSESLSLKREIGDRAGVGTTLSNIGMTAYNMHDLPAARRNLEESLDIFQELGDRQGIADALNNLGLVYYSERHYDSARQIWQDALAIFEEIDDRWGIALANLNIAKAHRDQGDYLRSRTRFLEAFRMANEIAKDPTLLEILQEYCVLLSYQGKPNAAARCNSLVMIHERTSSDVRQRAERLSKDLRLKLGADAFDTAQALGVTSKLDAIIARILQEA